MSNDFERIPAPEVAGEWVEEIASDLHKRLEDALKEAFRHGFLTLGRAKPQERLRFYMDRTLAPDLPLLLDKDYLEKRRAGVAPILECERLMQEYQQQVTMAVTAGMEPPEEPPYAYPWPVALAPGSASLIFELLANDFRKLWNAERKRVEGELETMRAQPEPMMAEIGVMG